MIEEEYRSAYRQGYSNAMRDFRKKQYIKKGISDVLEKIRAEIEQLPTTECTETCIIYIDIDDFKENVLAIIDNHNVESEK